MSRRLGLAALQLKWHPTDDKENLRKFEDTSRIAKADFPWLDLIFTGEYYLQRHDMFESWKKHAHTFPDALTNRLSDLARELETWLVPGTILERDGDDVYNTAIVFNPNGEDVASYRKIFPWSPREDYSPGKEFITFEIPDIGIVGLSICYDIWFPEMFRTLAWMGSELIIHPTATPTPDRDMEIILTQAQAIFNQCYVLSCNTISPQGGGQSVFVEPEGRILKHVGSHEEILTEVIDLDKVSWLREYGTYGNTPVWKSLRDSPLKGSFPPYEDFLTGKVLEGLGDLRIQKSVRNENKS